MNHKLPPPTALAVGDPTLELTQPPLAPRADSDSDSAQTGCARVAFAEGSEPHLTREIQTLLRRRLRLSAIIFAVGFAAFLVIHVLQVNYHSPIQVFLFGFHATLTVVIAILAGVLCHRCVIPLSWLRGAELIVFGLPGLFFVALQYWSALACCQEGYFDIDAGAWLILMFTYALFIPNTFRRAALVIGAMGVVPVLLLYAMFWTNPQVRALATVYDLTGFTMVMAISAGASLLGVDTIGSLRREAFEAKQLGQYRLKQQIGAGGMGEVYLAEHQWLKRPCVVKLIRPDKAGDPRLLARFQREVRATARLSHWNTVEIFDYGSTEDGTFYYVMEYLPGMSLAELVERFGPLPPERVVYLLRQVCDALDEAHTKGLVHRDIKPGNIFAAQRGGIHDVAKLLDFGLVKPLLEDHPMQLTTDGAITGSPLFMSPEQAAGEQEVDVRSDIYSLGAVGYYLLTGRPPFESDKPMKVLLAHIRQPAPPLTQYRPDVPPDLEAVILRCLEKTPADRFPDVTALAQALDACQAAGKWARYHAARWWETHQKAARPCA